MELAKSLDRMNVPYDDPWAEQLRLAAIHKKWVESQFPPCQQCGESDEVYSKYTPHAKDPSTWQPPLEELIRAGLGCYRCGT